MPVVRSVQQAFVLCIIIFLFNKIWENHVLKSNIRVTSRCNTNCIMMQCYQAISDNIGNGPSGVYISQ